MQRVKTFIRTIGKHVRDRRGFSLMDIIVATAIIAMITGISITYNHSSEEQLRIFKAQALAVGAVNRAKSFAAERYIGKDVPAGSFACAFGVHFDVAAKSVVIFQDIKPATTIYSCLDADGSYSPSLVAASGDFYDGGAGSKEMIETVPLDTLLTMTLQSGGADILFIPPDLSATSTGAFPLVVRLAGSGGRYGDTTIMAGGQITTR